MSALDITPIFNRELLTAARKSEAVGEPRVLRGDVADDRPGDVRRPVLLGRGQVPTTT